MVQGTSQIALIYRVYYKCMRTNMNVGALDRREKGETTLIQTTNPTARVSIPRSLKWNEITFPADWTLENENHVLQIQNPAQNPDLDFVYIYIYIYNWYSVLQYPSSLGQFCALIRLGLLFLVLLALYCRSHQYETKL